MRARIKISTAAVAIACLSLLTIGCSRHQKTPSVTWYYHDWMASSPYAPTFEVLDTMSSLGPYAEATKTINLKDLIKMHGHPCDGLVTAACALSVGLKKLFPDGVIDRTDLCCVTNNSPCYGDVAAYLTGGRIRFGTHKIAPKLKHVWILHRPSNGQTLRISLKEGVFPKEVAELESKIKSGEFAKSDIGLCQKLQWAYAKSLLQKPLDNWFDIHPLSNFVWAPDKYEHLGQRSDTKLKNVFK